MLLGAVARCCCHVLLGAVARCCCHVLLGAVARYHCIQYSCLTGDWSELVIEAYRGIFKCLSLGIALVCALERTYCASQSFSELHNELD